MYFIYLVTGAAVAYLVGSVNSAIIITGLVNKEDIRGLGNKNAGAANVARSVGKGWATFVFFFDAFKGVVPIIFAKLLIFTGNGYAEFLALYAMGIAAIIGHCKPVYYKFKGGGGMATILGIYFFFIPIEFFSSVLLGALIVALFIKNVNFRMTRWIPIVFVIITPFLTLSLNFVVDIPIYAHISLGGHAWYFLAGNFALSLSILRIDCFAASNLEEFIMLLCVSNLQMNTTTLAS